MDEDYDLVPHHEVEQLKKDMDSIKRGEFPSSHDLIGNLKSLNDSLRAMLLLFQEASDTIKVDEKPDRVSKKLDTVIEQNTKIAEGIVALADMIKGIKVQQVKPAPPQPRPMPAAEFPPPPEINPQVGPQPQMPNIPRPVPEMPPIPDFEEPKKKGLFGRFKK